jgi:hypothetical protein
MAKFQTSTLRPGLLVSLKTSTRGNVSYTTRDLELEKKTSNGGTRAKWETTRQIDDPAEHEAASEARSKARNLITAVCAHSAFGLLCPDDKAEELDKALAAAQEIVSEFNATAQLERVNLYVMIGRIEQDDVKAVQAINSEVRELMEDMTAGLKNLDVKAVREAANQLRSVGAMLSPDAQIRAQFAIDAAREAATKIKNAGEKVAVEIDTYAIRRITEQRTAFLDIRDEVKPVGKPKVSLRQLDTAQEGERKPAARRSRPKLDLADKAYNAENRKRGREIDKRSKAYYRAGEE